MKKLPLILAIGWTLSVMWNMYWFFAELPDINGKATWITVGNALALISYIVLAIYYWVTFIKSIKRDDGENRGE